MNKEIKARWVDALRSGVYTQTTGALRNEKGYCCLGVLCDLHAIATDNTWDHGQQSGYLLCASALPVEVANWAGVESTDPQINDIALSEYNDRLNSSFNEIADVIEKGL